MNEDIFTQRILVTILQIIAVPFCNLGSWARFTPDGFRVRDSWQKLTFREASYSLTGNHVFTYIIVACAALAIAIAWTKWYYIAIVPSAVQTIVVLILFVYFSALKNKSVGFPDLGGIVHIAVVIACLLVTILMLKAHLDEKKIS